MPHRAPPLNRRRTQAQDSTPGNALGLARFFYRDACFGVDAVKLLPGEYFVHDRDDLLLVTTLGSCIAVCLWDRQSRIGGMNHFVLPEGGVSEPAATRGRYGPTAMALLIDAMTARGASRATMTAKVFGGAQMAGGRDTLRVGERNTAFVLGQLHAERIPVMARDVLGVCARRLCFLPASGRAMVKRLAGTRAQALLHRGRA